MQQILQSKLVADRWKAAESGETREATNFAPQRRAIQSGQPELGTEIPLPPLGVSAVRRRPRSEDGTRDGRQFDVRVHHGQFLLLPVYIFVVEFVLMPNCHTIIFITHGRF